jgi:hypothetical protein
MQQQQHAAVLCVMLFHCVFRFTDDDILHHECLLPVAAGTFIVEKREIPLPLLA